jgi:hypothetical protein
MNKLHLAIDRRHAGCREPILCALVVDSDMAVV